MLIHSMYIHILPSMKPISSKTLRNDARLTIENCYGRSARIAARRITQFIETRLEVSGLTFVRFVLLAEIAAASDDSISALANRIELDQSTLSRTLRTLEVEGLIEIAAADADQRRKVVWLTEKGARRLEVAIALWRTAHGELEHLLAGRLAHRLARATDALLHDR